MTKAKKAKKQKNAENPGTVANPDAPKAWLYWDDIRQMAGEMEEPSIGLEVRVPCCRGPACLLWLASVQQVVIGCDRCKILHALLALERRPLEREAGAAAGVA